MVACGASRSIPAYGSPGKLPVSRLTPSQGEPTASVDAEQVFHVGCEPPVILERQHHAVAFGVGQARADAVDAPPERGLQRIAGKGRLVALHLHQVVERLDGLPSAGVQSHGGDAQPRGELDAPASVVDGRLPLFSSGDTKSWWIESIGSARLCRNAACFRRLHVLRRLAVHLPVQYLDARRTRGAPPPR